MKALTKQRLISPFLALFPIAVYFVMIVILSMLCELFGISGESYDKMFDLINEISFAIASVCACIAVKSRNKESIKKVIRVKNFDFSVPLMLAVFTWTFGKVSDGLCGLLLSNHMTVTPNGGMPLTVAGIVTAVICAPVFEEIIFRFAAVEVARGAYSIPVICIANGIVFSAMHGYNIQGFLNIFIGGVCAAYVYCKTRNLLYTMLEHAIHNAVCFLHIGSFAYYEKNGFILCSWYWLLINAVIASACVVWYFKVFRKKYTDKYFEVNCETGLPYAEEDAQTFEYYADTPKGEIV